MAKPRDTLTVRLCFMDVSNCARLRPFQLGDLVGRVCKQLGSPVDLYLRRLEHVYSNNRRQDERSQ